MFKTEIAVVHGLVYPRVGLDWVGNGSLIFVFSGMGSLGWVMDQKSQMCK